MITRLGVRNFKRFMKSEVDLRSLNVFTGMNGVGKSTLIQALLLARQASEDRTRNVVLLNDRYGLSLGEALDVLHQDAENQHIIIELHYGAQLNRFTFEVPDTRSLNLRVVDRPSVPPKIMTGHSDTFTYLSAERLGPRDQLMVTADDTDRIGVGESGQYTAHALATHESRQVDKRMLHPQTESHGVTTLRTQVESWASDIIRPVRIDAQWHVGISSSTIRFREPGAIGEPIRPANMGFGFSYALPIIVGSLLMKSGGLLIVENPEAHLHPAGQSKIGKFLARLAGSNVQVVVETHSDHVINGIRLAVAEEKSVSSDEVGVHFFGGASDVSITTLDMSEKGAFDEWPIGFFDQIEHDLGRLALVKRSRKS